MSCKNCTPFLLQRIKNDISTIKNPLFLLLHSIYLFPNQHAYKFHHRNHDNIYADYLTGTHAICLHVYTGWMSVCI